MASLVEQIKLLANPEPTSFDPEGDDFSATRARISQEDIKDDEYADDFDFSKLRRGNAPLLEEEDTKYGGRRVSRAELAALRGDFQESEESSESEEHKPNKQAISKHDKVQAKVNGSSHIHHSDDDNENDEGVAVDSDNDHGDVIDDDVASSASSDDEEASDDGESYGDDYDFPIEEGVQNFSTPNMTEELAKAKAVKMQLSLWDSFLEYRIRVQKALLVANRLPQSNDIDKFTAVEDNNLTEASHQGQKSLAQLLYKLLCLQEKLLEQNPETKNILYPGQPSKTAGHENDEEIASDTDEEEKSSESGKDSSAEEPNKESLKLPMKRKAELSAQEFEECISKRHATFQSYRDSTISKWGEKTRLASGKVNSKGFSSFDRSALSQIKQIMNDKPRLIKRTQLKRSSYRVFGKTEKEPVVESEQMDSVVADAHLKDYDPQVFDDDDFYHQLLRELIERRTTTSTDDPIEMGRQWLELQKLRRKIKKKIDTKASKGRKLRYNVHGKLVSYMAPIDRGTMPDSSRNELFSSLFGQSPVQAEANGVQVFR